MLTPQQQRAELAQAKRFIALQKRERSRADKLRMHAHAMVHLFAFLKGEPPCAPGQGRLL